MNLALNYPNRSQGRFFFVTLVLSLELFSTAVTAEGDFSSDSFGVQPVAIGAGPRALGMGGAFSAVADDATACTWNPAGLTQIERPEIAGSVGWYHSIIAGGLDSRQEDQVRPDHLSLAVPLFAFGCQQTFGIAWQRQFDFTRSLNVDFNSANWDDPDPSIRSIYFETDHSMQSRTTGAFSSLGFSYAIEPIPGLSFGISCNVWADRWTRGSTTHNESSEITLNAVSMSSGGPLAPLFSTRDDFETTTDSRIVSGTNFVFGGMWQISPAWNVALVFKPCYRLGIETDTTQVHMHQEEISGNSPTSTSETSSFSSESTLDHPTSVTIGAAWRANDQHLITADATITRWSQYRINDATGEHSPINFLVSPDEFRDLWTLRAGYEYVAVLPTVVLVPRCGASFEQLPATTPNSSSSTTHPLDVSTDQWFGLSAGLSLCRRNIIWDFGAQVTRGNKVSANQFSSADQTVDITLLIVRAGVAVQF